jgi:hypothetical protein
MASCGSAEARIEAFSWSLLANAISLREKIRNRVIVNFASIYRAPTHRIASRLYVSSPA